MIELTIIILGLVAFITNRNVYKMLRRIEKLEESPSKQNDLN